MSKKRKNLSDSGTGRLFKSLDDLKRDLSEEQADADESAPDPGEGAASERSKENTPDANEASESGPESGPERYEERMGRMTFHLPRELMDRLRNAVYWTPAGVTLSGMAREALEAAVEEIEDRLNDGERFPDRDADLKGGRPPE